MTDGPQLCALPGCSETVEQPNDGGPRRLYCSPAHRAAARKARHAARMEASAAPPAAEVAESHVAHSEVAHSEEITQPIVKAPDGEPSEQPTTELPAALGAPREDGPEPAAVPDREWSPAAAWAVSPPTLSPASLPSARTVRTITSKRVKKQKPARTAADRKNAGTHVRRRAIASVAIASLVAGGASYFVTNNVIPTAPTPLPPQAANDPSMDADVWASKAEVTLASLSSQLDAVAQAEASWLALPEKRRAQEPAAVQALKDRKALLEQQRATLMSQLEAFKALPDRTAELTSAQAQLDAVERTLSESTSTAASPDYQEALRQLQSQRDIRRQQRDHAAQALTDLRNGVEQALSSPLPADKDNVKTTHVVERVKAVVAGRPDPGDKDDDQEHKAAGQQEPATSPRRDDGDEERGDVGTTAPPDPERPNTPDILADGGSHDANGGDQNAAAGKAAGDNGGDRAEEPVRSVASALGSALGQGDTTNRDESANRREARGADDSSSNNSGNSSGESGDHGGGLGDVVRGVGGALLGGSSRDDDHGDSDARRERNKERGDDGDDRNDRSGWLSDRGDRDDDRSDSGDDDRKSDRGDKSDRDDDHNGVRGIADRLLGGDDDDDGKRGDKADSDKADSDKADRDDDGDHKRPSGKAERKRDKDREESKNRHHKSDSDKADSDKADRDDDGDHKRPSGKAERKRDKDREESKNRHHKSDSDKSDSDEDDKKGRDKSDRDDRKGSGHKDSDRKDKEDDGDHKKKDSDDDSDKKSDHGDKDDDGGKSDKKSDKGHDDGGDSGDDD
ncbi:hypothetical protein [Pseudonocardia adelaidensis]|uniref:Uncharacterized protein n=1 Tax=Pseudonocardia adelaidensis TaxID=648754 RepID=A0ABP9P090_9PSEU